MNFTAEVTELSLPGEQRQDGDVIGTALQTDGFDQRRAAFLCTAVRSWAEYHCEALARVVTKYSGAPGATLAAAALLKHDPSTAQILMDQRDH